MATTALGSELAAMHIVLAVTCYARTRLLNAIASRSRVARFALQSFVRARQRKLSLAIVVERPARPAHGVVAGPAVAAEPALVAIVVGMTIDALIRSILETPRLVASAALRVGVLANEGKSRQAVIEPNRRRPSAIAMALLALRPFLACMRIVVAVARHARHFQADLTCGLHVAARAFQPGVPATQGEARLPRVVERGPPPIGLRMALLARRAVTALVRARVFIAVT